MTAARSLAKWWEDQAEVRAFARVLLETFQLDWSASDVLYYFEKPWKWDDEHGRWIDAGCPDKVPDAPSSSDTGGEK